MLSSQAVASMDQVWFAAARQCSLHTSNCSLHQTHQRRKGSGKLVQSKTRASHADGTPGEKGEHTHQDVAEELLKLDPVAQARLKRVGEAAALVASLQAQQAALEKEIAQAAQASSEEARRLEASQAQRASERGADVDVLEAKRALLEAQQELQSATRERDALLASSSQDAERIESAKAGAFAAVGGLLGSLPYLAVAGQAQPSAALSAAQIAASCLLFGVTFRYVQSVAADNPHLRGGAIAAFGLVRGLAYADAAQVAASAAGVSPVDMSVVGSSALAAGESMLTFAFAAAAVDAATKVGLVKPFGKAFSSDQ